MFVLSNASHRDVQDQLNYYEWRRSFYCCKCYIASTLFSRVSNDFPYKLNLDLKILTLNKYLRDNTSGFTMLINWF